MNICLCHMYSSNIENPPSRFYRFSHRSYLIATELRSIQAPESGLQMQCELKCMYSGKLSRAEKKEREVQNNKIKSNNRMKCGIINLWR